MDRNHSREEHALMTALYIAGFVAFWAVLLIVVKRKAPEEKITPRREDLPNAA